MVSFTEINLQFKVQCYKTSTKAESYRFWSVSEPQSHSKFIVCPLLFCCIALIQPTWCLLFSESFDWMNRFLSTILHTHKLPAHCFCFVLFVCLFVLPESWILNLNYLPCFFGGGFLFLNWPQLLIAQIVTYDTRGSSTQKMFLNPAELICIYSIACCTLTDKFGLSLYQVDDVWVIVCSD